MVYRGTVQDGRIVLEPGVVLPEGTRVRVEPERAAAESVEDDPLAAFTKLALDAGVNDLAANVDHYLYGHEKRTDNRDGG